MLLNGPVPRPPYNGLVTNGSATISWTSVATDPINITFEIQNSVTLDSFGFGWKVNTSQGSFTAVLDGIPGGDGYYFQAVDTTNVLNVYAVSGFFEVFGAVSPVTLRQYLLYSKTEPPSALPQHFTPAVFQKSQQYGKDKAHFTLVSGLFKQCLISSILHFGFFARSWGAAGRFLVRFGLPDLRPRGEARLQQDYPALFVTDLLKGWELAFALGGPFLAAFLYIFERAGDRFVPWLMAFVITFQLIMVVLYPAFFPLFNKLSPLPAGDLRTRIEALASKLKFPLKHVYEIDGSKHSSHSNVYFFGLPWSKHTVIFNTLITQSSPLEIEAVVAHERRH